MEQKHYLCTAFGALAHLARAFDWQSKGGRFESCMLHSFHNSHISPTLVALFCYGGHPFLAPSDSPCNFQIAPTTSLYPFRSVIGNSRDEAVAMWL